MRMRARPLRVTCDRNRRGNSVLGLPQHPKSGHRITDFSSASLAASTIAVALTRCGRRWRPLCSENPQSANPGRDICRQACLASVDQKTKDRPRSVAAAGPAASEYAGTTRCELPRSSAAGPRRPTLEPRHPRGGDRWRPGRSLDKSTGLSAHRDSGGAGGIAAAADARVVSPDRLTCSCIRRERKFSPKPLRSQRSFDSIRILSESGPAPNRHCLATHIDVPGF
jgi:hypothetical protein